MNASLGEFAIFNASDGFYVNTHCNAFDFGSGSLYTRLAYIFSESSLALTPCATYTARLPLHFQLLVSICQPDSLL
jgi:hypothetical protein